MSQTDRAFSGPQTVLVPSACGVDGFAGAEVQRLATEFGALLSMLAKQRGNEKLLTDTSKFVQVQKGRMTKACSSCAQSLQYHAALNAEMQPLLELPIQNRRSDFLLRMVLAFYPHGFADKLSGGDPLAFPRSGISAMGRFMRDMLGALPYADLNADCSRLISRFPEVADRQLREVMFAHKASRVLLMKVLIRLLTAFQDLTLAEKLFLYRLTPPKKPIKSLNNKEKSTEPEVSRDHFRALCEGLFGEFVLQLQNPREGDDLEAWFGAGATLRVLDLLENLAEQAKA